MPTVIKVGQSGPVLERLSTVDLADHLREASAVLDAARREGARIVAEARAELERERAAARRNAHDSGYQEGYEAGSQAGFEAARDEALARLVRVAGDV